MKKIGNILLVVLVLFAFTACGKNNKEENKVEKGNKDSVVYFEDQSVGKIVVKDMNVAYYDNLSHIAFDLSNENEESLEYQEIVINYFAEDETLIYTTSESVGLLAGGDTLSFYLYTDIDLTNAKNVTYELH